VMKSAALTGEQRAILEKRGVLSPEEIHRLASKTKRALQSGESDHAACHSDYVDESEAKRIQSERLVQLRLPEGAQPKAASDPAAE